MLREDVSEVDCDTITENTDQDIVSLPQVLIARYSQNDSWNRLYFAHVMKYNCDGSN